MMYRTGAPAGPPDGSGPAAGDDAAVTSPLVAGTFNSPAFFLSLSRSQSQIGPIVQP